MSDHADIGAGAAGDASGAPLLIHLHNDKAGGGSLTAALTDMVGAGRAVDTRTQPDKTAHLLTGPERVALRLYAGHRSFGAHKHFTQTPLYICTVREPVSRFASYLAYVRRTPDHSSHALLDGLSPGEAFEAQYRRNAGIARNGQARHIMGARFRTGVTIEEIRAHIEKRFLLVAPIQEIERVVASFRAALALPPASTPMVNVRSASEVRIEIDRPLQDRILDANDVDSALCATVGQCFGAWLANAAGTLAGWAERFEINPGQKPVGAADA